MKKALLLFFILVLSSLNLYSQDNSVVLSKFTEGIIDLMVKEEINICRRYPLFADKYIEELSMSFIVMASVHEDGFLLECHAIDANPICPEDTVLDSWYAELPFWGEVECIGWEVKVFGSKNTPFFSCEGCEEIAIITEVSYEEFDPMVFSIFLDKNMKFVKNKSNINTREWEPEPSFADVEALIDKCFGEQK